MDNVILTGPKNSKLMISFDYSDPSKNFGDEDIFYAEEIEIKEEISETESNIHYSPTNDIFHSLDVQNEVIIDKDCNIAESNSYELAIQNLSSDCLKPKVSSKKCKKKKKERYSPDDLTQNEDQLILAKRPLQSLKPAPPKSFFGSSMGVSKCHICNKFTKRSCFEAHVQEHSLNGKKSKGEERSFTDEDDEINLFDPPKQQNIIFPEVYRCSYCNFVTNAKSKLEDHSVSHSENGTLMNEQSHFLSESSVEIKTHLHTHDINSDNLEHKMTKLGNKKQNGDKAYKCNLCGYKTMQLATFKNHLKGHYGENLYSCSHCEYQTVDRNSLMLHVRVHTTGKKSHKCKLCDYKCISKSSLKLHMKSHKDDEVFVCPICKFATKSRTSLSRHELLHKEEKPHKCSECSYQTAQKAALRAHMQRHKGEKPFKCPDCDYSSVEKTHLIRHMRQHTGEKPIFCFVCDYKCIQFGCLVTHVKRHNDTLMQCAFCHFNTFKSDALIGHLRAEHKRSWGKSPLQCPECSFKCFTKENLKKHTHNHAIETRREDSESVPFESDAESVSRNIYTCKLCDFQTTNKKYLKSHRKKEH